ncbi:MAG: hypothetical protein QS721_08985 [Candidatus Endonucleobacter sp. (ex Gigantidas childressi)]|nr:hypothetical protein [Candidatus Endonucleobacter sp. (ex Gigantidas childressi)]
MSLQVVGDGSESVNKFTPPTKTGIYLQQLTTDICNKTSATSSIFKYDNRLYFINRLHIMNEDNIKKLTIIIAANCVNDSVLEECHNNKQITDTQLTLFKKQISDRVYTFLTYLLNKPADEYSVLMENLVKTYPENWPIPNLDPQLIKINKKHEKEDARPVTVEGDGGG